MKYQAWDEWVAPPNIHCSKDHCPIAGIGSLASLEGLKELAPQAKAKRLGEVEDRLGWRKASLEKGGW